MTLNDILDLFNRVSDIKSSRTTSAIVGAVLEVLTLNDNITETTHD